MNATFVTGALTSNGGGVPEAIRQLARAQACHGVQVNILGLRDSGVPLEDWNPCTVEALPVTRIPGFPCAMSFGKALEVTHPDMIHTHGLWQQPSVVVPSFCKSRNLQWMVSPHGMLDAWAIANSRWKKRVAAMLFENRHLRGAACLHALCGPESVAIRSYGLKQPICVIPNGIDLPAEDTDIGNRESKFGKRILLFLGRLHPKKGLVNALMAWKQVRVRKEWQFVIAGWDQGGHEGELKRLCDELGLKYLDVPAVEFADNRAPTTDHGASVIFIGPAFGEQKDQLLRQTSAFILPSFSEGLPMAVLEAWAYNLPVLMTNECNLPEGFLADAAVRIETSVCSIADGMRELLQASASDLRSTGNNGRALVERQFAWPMVAARMKEVYDWILGGGTPPSTVVSS